MKTEMATMSGKGLAGLDAFRKGLQNARSSIVSGTALGDPLLKMNKAGVWNYGADGVEVEEESEWLVNVASMQHGYICWVDGSVAGEIMTSIMNPLPELGALPVYSKPWERQEAAQLVCLSGEDAGLQVLMKNNSKGFHDAFAVLLDEIISRVDAGETAIFPVVRLEVSSYKHKQYGTVYKPVLRVVAWQANEPTEEAAPEPVEEAPRRRRRR